MKPRVCILKADGTNCDQETAYAFSKAGGNAEVVLLNSLKTKKKKLSDFEILAIPGGFSYGDDIASGKLFALELLSFLKDELIQFVVDKKLIIGICNGFQVLVRTGLLPFRSIGTMSSTLSSNVSGSFECRWINLIIEQSPCIFTKSLVGTEITLPVAHAEGNFFAENQIIQEIERSQLVPLKYSIIKNATQQFPDNPNGSIKAIAGICDMTGRIFGLMPHPERFIEQYQYPNWRQKKRQPEGLPFFENAVKYF